MEVTATGLDTKVEMEEMGVMLKFGETVEMVVVAAVDMMEPELELVEEVEMPASLAAREETVAMGIDQVGMVEEVEMDKKICSDSAMQMSLIFFYKTCVMG
jgi:hypothetical protein